MAWLDYDGLLYFWQKIKAKLNDKVDKVEGKGVFLQTTLVLLTKLS